MRAGVALDTAPLRHGTLTLLGCLLARAIQRLWALVALIRLRTLLAFFSTALSFGAAALGGLTDRKSVV